jgi:hypothetical protein
MIFWEVLTGGLPRGAPLVPSSSWKNIGKELDELVYRLCRPNPNDRFQLISEFWYEFSELVERRCALHRIAEGDAFRRALSKVIAAISRIDEQSLTNVDLQYRDDFTETTERYYLHFWDLAADQGCAPRLMVRGLLSDDPAIRHLAHSALEALRDASVRILKILGEPREEGRGGRHYDPFLILGDGIVVPKLKKADRLSRGISLTLLKELH